MNRFPDFYPIENDEFSKRGVGNSTYDNNRTGSRGEMDPSNSNGFENYSEHSVEGIGTSQDTRPLQEFPSTSTSSTRPSTGTEATAPTTVPIQSPVNDSVAAGASSDTSTARRRFEKEMHRSKRHEIQSKLKRISSSRSNNTSSNHNDSTEERNTYPTGYGSDESDLLQKDHRQQQRRLMDPTSSRHRSESTRPHHRRHDSEQKEKLTSRKKSQPRTGRRSTMDVSNTNDNREELINDHTHRRRRGSVEVPVSTDAAGAIPSGTTESRESRESRAKGKKETSASTSDEKRMRRKPRDKERDKEGEHSNHERRERRSRREKHQSSSNGRRRSVSQGAEKRRHRSRRRSREKEEKRRTRRGSASDGETPRSREVMTHADGSEPDVAGGKPNSSETAGRTSTDRHGLERDNSKTKLKDDSGHSRHRRKKTEQHAHSRSHSRRRRGSSLDRAHLTSRSKKLLEDANGVAWATPTRSPRRTRSGSVDRARGSRSPKRAITKDQTVVRRDKANDGAISPSLFSASTANGQGKTSKPGGTKLDSKLRAFLEFTKNEQGSTMSSKRSADVKDAGAKKGIDGGEMKEFMNSSFDDDGATLITRAESVQGESRVITGKHRDLLKIAKLTSRSSKHLGSGRRRSINQPKQDHAGISRDESRSSEINSSKHINQSLTPITTQKPKRSLAFEIMRWASLVKSGQLSSELNINSKRSPLAFRQSTILSLRAETVLNAVDDPNKLRDHGVNCFQPFFIESADVMYQYPDLDSSKDETILGPDVLSAFCFPYGVSVRFFPRAALEGAKKLGWFGESGDKYQLQAFTSMTGATKYGVALVVQEELKFDSEMQRGKIIDSLKKRMARRRAVRRVILWWRRILFYRKYRADDDITNSTSAAASFQNSSADSGGLSAAVTRMSSYWYSVSKDSKGSASFNVDGSNSSLGSDRRKSVFPELKKQQACHMRSQSEAFPSRGHGLGHMDLSSSEKGEDMDTVRWPTREEQMMASAGSAVTEEQTQQLQHVLEDSMILDNISFTETNAAPRMVLGQRRGGHRSSTGADGYSSVAFPPTLDESGRSNFGRPNDAFQTMMEHEQLGYTIVVETCYVFTNVHPDQQVPLFCAMQQIIEKQREHQYRFENIGADLSAKDLHLMSFREEDESSQKEIDFAFSDHYDVLFDYMHKNLRLTYNESLMTNPENPYDFIHRRYSDVPKFEFRLPLQYFDKQALPLPLPNMTAEYGLSRLLLTIRHEALLMVLKLLLLERSVLVVGKTVEEVTCCTCTLLQLLHPFTWASAFMPLIRSDMLEFVSSPVPFLAGMVARDLKQLDSIKRDPCVKEAVREGLSIIDLYRGRLTVTSAEGIWEMLVDSHLPSEKMISFQTRLEFLASNENSTMHSFKKFFKLGLSARENLTLHAVKQFLTEYLANLANAAVDSSQQLRMFSRIDSETDAFEFSHDEFADLRRKQILARVGFFDEMSKTQLFLGYVEENCRKLYKRKKLMSGIEAMVIAHWGVKHWRRLKETRETEGK